MRGHRYTATFAALAWSLYSGGWSTTARADWNLATHAAVRRDDNVANARATPDVVADTSAAATLSLSQFTPLDGGYGINLGVHLGGEVFDRFRGLNTAEIGAAIGLRKKWGLGAYAPWARIGMQAMRSEYDDAYRTGWSYRADISAGRRFGDRWNGWVEFAGERRTAGSQADEEPGISSDVYHLRGATWSANGEFAWRPDLYLQMGILARHGDVVSTAHENDALFDAAQAIAEDDVFGDDTYAYKIRARTYGFNLGLQFVAATHSLLGLDFRRFLTRADGGINYAKSVLEATWVCEF